jgi:hypothetical protein
MSITTNFKEKAQAIIKQLQNCFVDSVIEFTRRKGYQNFYVCGYKPYFNDGDECVFSVNSYTSFTDDESPKDVMYEKWDKDFLDEFDCDELEAAMYLPILIVKADGTFEWRDCDHE